MLSTRTAGILHVSYYSNIFQDCLTCLIRSIFLTYNCGVHSNSSKSKIYFNVLFCLPFVLKPLFHIEKTTFHKNIHYVYINIFIFISPIKFALNKILNRFKFAYMNWQRIHKPRTRSLLMSCHISIYRLLKCMK